jgi:4-hydroxybenzoate polyprenyltransferase
VDVLFLAGLYTLRIIGGAAATGIELSFWLLAFSTFLFLSLALVKRYYEMIGVRNAGKRSASGRDYSVADMSVLQSLGTSSGLLAVLVLALYINSPEVHVMYRDPRMLWLLCPVLLYWVSRIWMKSHRGELHDDPVVFAATDRASQLCMVLCASGIVLAV